MAQVKMITALSKLEKGCYHLQYNLQRNTLINHKKSTPITLFLILAMLVAGGAIWFYRYEVLHQVSFQLCKFEEKQWLKTEIQKAIKEQNKSLILRFYNGTMIGFSEGLGQPPPSNTLIWDFRCLSTVPPEIGQLTQLTQLTIEYVAVDNKRLILPPEISQLTHLEILKIFDVGGNPLTTIPPEILAMPHLQIVGP